MYPRVDRRFNTGRVCDTVLLQTYDVYKQSAWVNTGFVNLAVAELLSGGYVQTVSATPYICSPLSEEALGA